MRTPSGYRSIKTRIKTGIRTRAPFLVPPLRVARSIAGGASKLVGRVARRIPIVRDWRAELLARRRRAIFGAIYGSNRWFGVESRSGIGSELEPTARLRQALPGVLEQYEIRSMLDIPCGDFHWMSQVQLDVDYIGADLVPEIVERNQAMFAAARRRFETLDMVRDELPRCDLIFCRDGLVHLSNEEALLAIERFKQSGSRYLMATMFVKSSPNRDIRTGDWRVLNLTLGPFRFPAPLAVIRERDPSDPYPDKSVALWRLADLP